MDILFCETVLVPPTKYRPIRLFKGDKFENPQSVNLRRLLEASETIRAIRLALSGNKEKALLVSTFFSLSGKNVGKYLLPTRNFLMHRFLAESGTVDSIAEFGV